MVQSVGGENPQLVETAAVLCTGLPCWVSGVACKNMHPIDIPLSPPEINVSDAVESNSTQGRLVTREGDELE